MSIALLGLVLVVAAVVSVVALVAFFVMRLRQTPPQTFDDQPTAGDLAVPNDYVAPDNPYHSPGEHGAAAKRRMPAWTIIAVLVGVGLFGLLACGAVGLTVFSARTARQQAIQARDEAIRSEQRARQAAEQAREAQSMLEQSIEDGQQSP